MNANAATAAIGAGDTVPTLVLDTNVVLDWLFFRDPRCAALAEAVTSRHVRWVACAAMREELQHVLDRGIRGEWRGEPVSVLQRWDRWATMVEAGDEPAPRSMRCTDADDQKFIDLALQIRASALLSADRAVLKLARRAASHGLKILTADNWQRHALTFAAGAASPP